MLELTALVPAFPLAGFITLTFLGSRLPRRAAAAVGAGSVGLSALAVLAVGWSFISAPPAGGIHETHLWTWFEVGSFRPRVEFQLDALALAFLAVITGVGFLIHLYSVEFMREEERYARFFAWMNLFVSSMTILVLAGDLLLLYLGWEAVGLSSYLLIGFWHQDPANGRAARKAFVMTRVGDAAMAVGLFLLASELGTLRIREVLPRAPELAGGAATSACLLLLLGAAGKSGQLPLQTWLPDAMAGPTPVSALIHAATMVTAGVYLIARTHALFMVSPEAQAWVAGVGAATLLLGAASALVQTDLKRVLAYSTMSQIGYMFLALGVGAWSAAVFHFVTHAFFKALLFLGAGAISAALHHTYDLRKMGGLRRELPAVFWTFLAGAASLAALPLITAGYWSKDLILAEAWTSPRGGPLLWAAGAAGALLTSLYAFRMVFLAFFGERWADVERRPGKLMTAPLWVLAALSIAGGFLKPELGFPSPGAGGAARGTVLLIEFASAAASLLGVYLAYLLFLRNPGLARRWKEKPVVAAVERLLFSGWGFDRLYDRAIVQPFLWLARVNRGDFLDGLSEWLAELARAGHRALRRTQTGRLRWYAMGLAAGAAAVIAIAAFT